jgi:ribosomal-protein-alanine N-acetyltransferase
MLLRKTVATRATAAAAPARAVAVTDWRTALPRMRVEDATLRELQVSDAPALLQALSTEQVTRFISPPPTTVEGFERFIAWTAGEHAAGRYICFAIVPDDCGTVKGIIQIRQLDPSFHVGEWGFALDHEYWGTGLFQAAAKAALAFAFTCVGVHRLEARAAVDNGRGNGALRKLGATADGVLRRSFIKDGIYHDQILWGIVSSEWMQEAPPPRLH